jgi:hypothetical protein
MGSSFAPLLKPSTVPRGQRGRECCQVDGGILTLGTPRTATHQSLKGVPVVKYRHAPTARKSSRVGANSAVGTLVIYYPRGYRFEISHTHPGATPPTQATTAPPLLHPNPKHLEPAAILPHDDLRPIRRHEQCGGLDE